MKRGTLALKNLSHLPLHSLPAPDGLCFALFFCRGKQLGDGERQSNVWDLQRPGTRLDFNELKWPSVYPFNPLHCTFKLARGSQSSSAVPVSVVYLCTCVCVCASHLMSSCTTIVIPLCLFNWPLCEKLHYAIRVFSLRRMWIGRCVRDTLTNP